MVESVQELHVAAVRVWTGLVQAFYDEQGGNSQAGGAAALAFFSGPAFAEPGKGGARDIATSLAAWAVKWQRDAGETPAQQGAGGAGAPAEPVLAPLEIVRAVVGLLGDFMRAFHPANVMPLVQEHGSALVWLTAHCHEREKGESGTAAAETVANDTRKIIMPTAPPLA